MRRILFLTAVSAFGACARRSADSAKEAYVEPFAIGGGIADAEGDAADVADASQADATLVAQSAPHVRPIRTGCFIDGIGTNGGVDVETKCEIDQEYDRDAARPFLGIWGAPPRFGIPRVKIIIARSGPVALGVQPSTAFLGHARVEIDKSVWLAETGPSVGTIIAPNPTGSFQLTLTSIRKVHGAGLGAYEMHGTVDAQLIPDWQGTATGYIDLHAEF